MKNNKNEKLLEFLESIELAVWTITLTLIWKPLGIIIIALYFLRKSK